MKRILLILLSLVLLILLLSCFGVSCDGEWEKIVYGSQISYLEIDDNDKNKNGGDGEFEIHYNGKYEEEYSVTYLSGKPRKEFKISGNKVKKVKITANQIELYLKNKIDTEIYANYGMVAKKAKKQQTMEA